MIPTPEQIAAWVAALQSDDFHQRRAAASALARVSDPAAVKPLLDALDDPDAVVRAEAATGLGRQQVVEAIEPLIVLLDDFSEVTGQHPHYFVSQYAAGALIRIGTKEAQEAVHNWRPTAEAHLKSRAVHLTLAAFREKEPAVREAAIKELVSYGRGIVPTLLNALKDDVARVRQGAAQTLGFLEDPAAVEPLIAALEDPDSGVWSQATGALARIGTDASAHLHTALKAEHQRTRQGAAIALWRIERAEDAFKGVLQALQDEDVVVRGSAISSLWQQPDERAVATLQIRLTMEKGMMARYVLQALQTIGTREALATVHHWLQENNGASS